jgi:Chaperone of endosialidase
MANQYISDMSALWNSAGTTYSAIKMNVTNAASAAGSALMQLQIAATDKFSIDATGNVVASGTITAAGLTTSAPSLPSSNDGAALGSAASAWSDLYLAIGGVINWGAGDVTFTHSSNAMAFAGATSGYSFDNQVVPSVSDAGSLGNVSNGWSDLYLATGGKLNFSDAVPSVIEHTAAAPATPAVPGWLTVTAGDFRVTSAGTDSASVATLGGTQTLTHKTLTGAVLNGTIGATTPATGAFTTLTTSGTITATGAIASSATVTAADSFVSSTTTANFGTTGAGTIHLRPNGVASTTGQITLDSSGNITTAGTMTVSGALNTTATITNSSGSYVGTAGLAVLGVTSGGSGTIALRPRGYDSGSQQWTLDSNGNVGQIGPQYYMDSPSSAALYLDNGGSGNPAFIQSRTNGAPRWITYMGDGAAESGGNVGSYYRLYSYNDAGAPTLVMTAQRDTSTVTFSGSVTSGGTVTSASNFDTTSTTCILSATNGGAIYFRPNGPASAVEQMVLNSNGGLQMSRPTVITTYCITAFGQTEAAAVIGYNHNNTIYGMLGRTDAGVGTWSFYGNGLAFTSSGWTTSDMRVKSDIADCDCANAYQKVKAIGVRAYRKDGMPERKGLGFDEMGWLAQEIEAVIPEAVLDVGIPVEDTAMRMRVGGDTVKATNDRTMLATLWAAVQHQAGIIEALEGKVAALEGR